MTGCSRASYGEQVDGGSQQTALEMSCPFCAKVALFIAEGGVEADLYFVDLANKPLWLKGISSKLETPVARMPDSKTWVADSGQLMVLCAERFEGCGELMGEARPQVPPLPLSDGGEDETDQEVSYLVSLFTVVI